VLEKRKNPIQTCSSYTTRPQVTFSVDSIPSFLS